MGKVILGMPGSWAKDCHEVADHYTTKIGGLPDWPIPEVDIKSNFLKCGACGSRLGLVVQIYAPVSSETSKIEERIIYIFGCTMQKCGSNPLSWRVLRVQKACNEEASSSPDKMSPLGISSEPVSSNRSLEDINSFREVGDDDIDLEELSRALSEAATLVSHSKKKSSHKQRKTVKKGSQVKPITKVVDFNIPVLPCFYIYSQEESLSRHVSALCSDSKLPIKMKECEHDDHKDEETWAEEGYEYDSALFVDRTFMKFKKRMDAYPEQCFRYSDGGKPLLASKDIEVPANCGFCGGSRHYEMQLMPPLLYYLKEPSDDMSSHSPMHWDWMTLIVYTCSKNCCGLIRGQEGTREDGWTVSEETVIAQFE